MVYIAAQLLKARSNSGQDAQVKTSLSFSPMQQKSDNWCFKLLGVVVGKLSAGLLLSGRYTLATEMLRSVSSGLPKHSYSYLQQLKCCTSVVIIQVLFEVAKQQLWLIRHLNETPHFHSRGVALCMGLSCSQSHKLKQTLLFLRRGHRGVALWSLPLKMLTRGILQHQLKLNHQQVKLGR